MPGDVLDDEFVYNKVWSKMLSFRNDLSSLLKIRKGIIFLPYGTKEKMKNLLVLTCESREVDAWANDYLYACLNQPKEELKILELIKSFQNESYLRLVLTSITQSVHLHSDLIYVKIAEVRHLLEDLISGEAAV